MPQTHCKTEQPELLPIIQTAERQILKLPKITGQKVKPVIKSTTNSSICSICSGGAKEDILPQIIEPMQKEILQQAEIHDTDAQEYLPHVDPINIVSSKSVVNFSPLSNLLHK